MNKIIFLVAIKPIPDKKLDIITGIMNDAEKGLNALRPIIEYEIIFGKKPQTEINKYLLKSYFKPP